MSLLTRLFSKKKDDDYESILSALALDIQKRQVKLSEIRLRERRATLAATLYTLAAWVVYVTVWYMDMLPSLGMRSGLKVEKAVKGLPVLIGPIIILFIRRIVQIWYTSKGDKEERTLQNLLKQQRAKVEEIKKKTNYYSTRELLQRYDEPSPSNSPLRQRSVPQPQPSTPQRPPAIIKNQTATPVSPALRAQLSPSAPSAPPPGPPRKQWLDKLADVVLGEDDQAARYALICEKCFSHNGLVKESVWEETQYVCPKCQHFNPSQRSKKQNRSAAGSSSPSGPATATNSPVSPITQTNHSTPRASLPASKLSQSVSHSPPSPQSPSDKDGEGNEMMDVEED
ncbi:hypothetical protein K435DRAFT_855027 [Dendrothele bispora CBS 962.96]|uniref:Endoplasmic reticulum junction formation protein lunapark n=1 Tax=Dendrothele bispora (strain CBS 962.96) TaxID=1314807 RepID=A0A4S8MCD1_DENBC|nr:hypothetical protein K435DRAFT_855027 [Dendrothele bispora CBS 962.96]